MESDDGLSGYSACDITGNEEVMAEIVATYTRNKDKYDMEWHQAAYDAIRTEISKAEEAGLLSSGISA